LFIISKKFDTTVIKNDDIFSRKSLVVKTKKKIISSLLIMHLIYDFNGKCTHITNRS